MYFPAKIFAGSASIDLALEIQHYYGERLGDKTLTRFKDGEMKISYEETLRGCNVYLIQSTYQPHENLFELLLMADGAKRASANSVTAVVPYLGYTRQDRKDQPRVPLSAKLVANLLQAAGIDRIITMDLHADQMQGFFDIPVDHLYASAIFVPYIKSLNLKNLAIASPDVGGTKRAEAYAKYLNTEMITCYKYREKPNEVAKMEVLGDVKGKNIILLDDIIDAGGTIKKAAEKLIEKGAKSVRASVTHPVMSQGSYELIEESPLTELVVTNTIPLRKQSNLPDGLSADKPSKAGKIKVVSVAKLFSDVIKNVNRHEPISPHFIF